MNEQQNKSLTASPQLSPAKVSDDGLTKSIQATGATQAELVAEQSRAEIQGAMTLAKKYPRNEFEARAKILRTCESLSFAERAIYKKPVGWKDLKETGGKWERLYVEGPSIRLAEEVLRHWGNTRVLENVLYEDNIKRLVRVTCYDLESNLAYGEDLLIEKTVERKNAKDREVISERINSKGEKISIVIATEDEVRNKEKAMVSKAIRNNGLRLIPVHIIDDAVYVAKLNLKSNIAKDFHTHIERMKSSFKTFNIEIFDLEQYLGHPLSQITIDEIADLKAVFNSIKNGESKWQDYFVEAEESNSNKKEVENAEMDIAVAEDWVSLEEKLKAGNEKDHQKSDETLKKKEDKKK